MKFNLNLNFMYFLLLCLVFAQVNAEKNPICTYDCRQLQKCAPYDFDARYCDYDQYVCWQTLNCDGLNPCLESGIYQYYYSSEKFYVCVNVTEDGFNYTYHKYVFRCPTHQVFDSEKIKCIDTVGPWITTTKKPETTTHSFIPGFGPITLRAETGSTDFECTTTGTFKDPESCKTYYYCNEHLEKLRFMCHGPTYFNEHLKRCSPFLTVECFEQITNHTLKAEENPF